MQGEVIICLKLTLNSRANTRRSKCLSRFKKCARIHRNVFNKIFLFTSVGFEIVHTYPKYKTSYRVKCVQTRMKMPIYICFSVEIFETTLCALSLQNCVFPALQMVEKLPNVELNKLDDSSWKQFSRIQYHQFNQIYM